MFQNIHPSDEDWRWQLFSIVNKVLQAFSIEFGHNRHLPDRFFPNRKQACSRESGEPQKLQQKMNSQDILVPAFNNEVQHPAFFPYTSNSSSV
ncbi:MAG: hypothetical protein OXC63_04370 [Aestuariivita sp.]|nr:hypothetical protein [Aestuariivita sp.]